MSNIHYTIYFSPPPGRTELERCMDFAQWVQKEREREDTRKVKFDAGGHRSVGRRAVPVHERDIDKAITTFALFFLSFIYAAFLTFGNRRL